MSFTNKKKPLVIAFLVAVIAAIGLAALFNNVTFKTNEPATSEFDYVYIKTPVKKGDVITKDNVGIKNTKINIAGGYQDVNDVIGKTAGVDMEEEKIVIEAFLENEKKSEGPSIGFRSVALPIAKSGIPPYVQSGKRYDLYTGSNELRIENVKILDIVDQPNVSSNKMIILEINSSDVPNFIDNLKGKEKYVLVQKNVREYEPYKFYYSKKVEAPAKTEKPDGYIPPISSLDRNIDRITDKQIEVLDKLKDSMDYELQKQQTRKEVEVIVGSQKTKMEFNN